MRVAIYMRVGTQKQIESMSVRQRKIKEGGKVGMVKIKNPTEDCNYVIYPLGKGLPLCLYQVVKDKKLDDVKLRELPICKYKNYCPKTEEVK